MDETADPRVEFGRRLRALQEATGLSVRQLEVESKRTPRRRREERHRVTRSTIADMTNGRVRPGLANFEVFVDTCLRFAAEKGISLPPGLDDRDAWDEAYRSLREHADRYSRRSAAQTPMAGVDDAAETAQTLPAEPDDVPEEQPHLQRRKVLLATSVVLTMAGAGLIVPVWWHGSGAGTPEPDPGFDDSAYSPVGRLLSPPIAKDDPVWSVAIGMMKGEALAVVGRADGTVQLWNPVTGRARSGPLAGHDKPVFSVALSAPIAVSGSVDGTLRVWDLTADPPTSTRMGDRLPGGINSVALGTVSGRTVAVSAGDDRTVRIWDPAEPKLTGKVFGEKLNSEVKSVAVGTLKGGPIAVSGSADGTVRLWDLNTGRTVRLLGAHESTVWTVAIGTVRGRTLAVSGSADGDVRSWDLTETEPTGMVLGDRSRSAVKTVDIGTVSGRTVAISGSDDNNIRIWDLATGRPYGNGLTGPDKGAESIAIGHLGGRATIVSGHWDGTIWTWSL